MKRVSLDQTLHHVRELPEELRFDEVAAFVVAAPLVAGGGMGLFQWFLHTLKIKYFTPMLFTGTTTLGVAIYLGIQTFSPSPEGLPSGKPVEPARTESTIDLRKDQPFGGLSFLPDSGKKPRKITRTREVRIVRNDTSQTTPEELPELAPLPPLPPLPPGAPEEKPVRKETRREQRIIELDKGEASSGKVRGCGEDDAFLSAMLAYLNKQNLLTQKDKFQLQLTPAALKINGSPVGEAHHKEVLRLFKKHEKTPLRGDSSIELTKDGKGCSVSKSIDG